MDGYEKTDSYVQQDISTTYAYCGVANRQLREGNIEPPGASSVATIAGCQPQTQITDPNGDPVSAYNSSYLDTAIPQPLRGPPYILVQSRPIMQKSGTPLQVYNMATIHYYCDVEVEELGGSLFGPKYDPTGYALLGGASASETADQYLSQACQVGPADNRVGRINTPILFNQNYV